MSDPDKSEHASAMQPTDYNPAGKTVNQIISDKRAYRRALGLSTHRLRASTEIRSARYTGRAMSGPPVSLRVPATVNRYTVTRTTS